MSSYTPRGRVRIGLGGTLIFRGDYVPPVVAGLKAFPFSFRDYAPDDGKAWTIRPPYAEAALELILRHIPECEIEYAHQSRTDGWPSRQRTDADHYRTLHLLPTAPIEVVGASFRALAKSAHSDVGGSDEAMRRLNEAHEALSRRLSA